MKNIKELLIAVLILAVVAFWYNSTKTKERLKEFDEKEKQMKAQLDSIQKLQHEADLAAVKALTDLNVSRSELSKQSHVAEKYRLRYETLRRTGVIRLSDAQIDSAVARLYPIR